MQRWSGAPVRFPSALHLLGAMFCASLALCPTQGGVVVYLSGNDQNYTTGNIWRTEAGTNKIETVYTVGFNDGRPMMVNSIHNSLYWTTYYPGQLWSSGMCGESPQLLVDQGENTTTRAIQFKDDKVYWSNEVLGAIYRADLDSSNVETVISGFFGYSQGFWDFELYGDRIYWTSWSSSSVKSINLDGSGFQTISLNGVTRAFSIEVADDRLFISDIGTGQFDRVVSCDLKGGDVVELVGGLTQLYSLDVFEGRLYYASLAFNPGLNSLIHSLPIDGGKPQLEMQAPGIQLWQIHVVELAGIAAGLDIKPGSCPNSFNPNSNGVLPVALVGSDSFDVLDVDLSTVLLSRADGLGGSVAPNEGPPGPHSVFADVATPFDGEPCGCHDLAGDGIDDLSMRFKSQEVVAALELNDLPPGALVELCVSGELLDGTEFEACDCIRVVPPGDMDGDGLVGVEDLLRLLAQWGMCGPTAECSADYHGDAMVGVVDLLIMLGNWG